MRRMLGAVVLGLAAAAVAHAHALFLVPDAGDAAKVRVIFGDQLAPDPATKDATWKRLEGLKLSARDGTGKVTPVKFTREKDHLLATVPAGTAVVYGEVQYGLFAKGNAAPALIKYYPKAIVGAVPADGGKLGDAAEVDIVPKVENGKVRFQVLARGKPVTGATVAVMEAGHEHGEAQEKTDGHGWTKAFPGGKKYGVTYRQVEKKAGELDGKKYEGVSHTATLVVDVK
jgi:uncharacterized GH25 family protein